jgi:hypothetical protein
MSFQQWQCEVLTFLQADFEEVLQHVSLDDVDWPAWRRFYEEGRSPRAAVDRALERDL